MFVVFTMAVFSNHAHLSRGSLVTATRWNQNIKKNKMLFKVPRVSSQVSKGRMPRNYGNAHDPHETSLKYKVCGDFGEETRKISFCFQFDCTHHNFALKQCEAQ